MLATTAPPPTGFIPIAEAAKRAGVSRWTLRRHCSAGRLAFARSSEGGRLLVEWEAVADLLRRFATEGGKAVQS